MKKILIIEDDLQLQDIYKTRLTQEGYFTVPAVTGEEGFMKAVKDKPDLIILDIMLPGGTDGMIILDQLKKEPATKNIPVIVATNIDDQAVQALSRGAVWYFVKAQSPLDAVVKNITSLIGK